MQAKTRKQIIASIILLVVIYFVGFFIGFQSGKATIANELGNLTGHVCITNEAYSYCKNLETNFYTDNTAEVDLLWNTNNT